MNWLFGKILGNPILLVWIALAAFAAGAVSGGGAAWTVQGWRLDAVQAKFDGFVVVTKAEGEAAAKEKTRTEAAHAKTTKEIKDAIPKQIAAARSGAVAAYRVRHPDTSCGGVPHTPVDSGGTDAACKEQVAAGWSGTTAPAFIEDCAEDAAMIGAWQDWARGIGFPIQ